jgi:23S rRNA G2445 N2-methylase RlmL
LKGRADPRRHGTVLSKNTLVITCAKGIPPFLEEELVSFGFPIRSVDVSSVETEGTLYDAMRLNLSLRTGQRVLFLLKEFLAKDPEALYREISRIRWEDYLTEKAYLCVTSTVDTPTIKDSRFANLKSKDAIVDRFYEKFGRRPDSGPDKRGTVIHLHWKGNLCQLYMDTSGEPLSKRGYRKISVEAPMQETLAAAVILASGWKGDGNFVNPMCGSGTLAIEAAWIGLGRAPGLLRGNYGFMHWKGFPEASWRALRKKARNSSKSQLTGKIIATDISSQAIEAAKKNAMTAGVAHLIEFGICDYSGTTLPEGGGVVVLNPPYGDRLGEIRALEKTYKGIGDFFKQRCRGYWGYLFTGNLELAKKVGLRTKRRIPFFNGEIECRLLEYELYEGSRKPSKTVRDEE